MNLLHPLNITTFVYKRQNHSRELAAYLNEDDRGGFAARDSATQLKLQTAEGSSLVAAVQTVERSLLTMQRQNSVNSLQ
ncbi:hypothetical protein SESBI_21536 [Sesbania bispinosa]|nr:hypothetical protein SESBI_21536 [Sesbania bispinosa]